MLNIALHVEDVLLINDEVVQMKYKRRVEEKLDDFNTNVLIALFTTSQARIRLYRALDKIGERALYCDTGLYLSSFVRVYGEREKEIAKNIFFCRFGYLHR